LGVPDGPHAVQPERIEEALQVGAERVPAVARRRLVALAVAALIEGEDAVARGEAARIWQPEPGVEAGRVEEEERRAVPAEVEVVEAEVADADVAVGGLGLARHRSALSRAPELCQNAGTDATKRAWTSRSRRPSSPSPKRRAPGSRRTCRPPGAATTAGRAPMTRSGSGSRATGSGSSTRAAGRRSPGRASTAAGARRGDGFVVNGQKVWTSYADVADWCFLLCRTEPAAPKHHGISLLLVDMRSPGITVRPLKQITGDAEFSEVFFEDVRVPAEMMVGAPGAGWQIAIGILAHERGPVWTFTFQRTIRRSLER